MGITSAEFKQLYLFHGDDGTEVLPKDRVGDILGLSRTFLDEGEAQVELSDLSADEKQSLMQALANAGSTLYQVFVDKHGEFYFDGYADLDDGPIESVQYAEGWFGCILIGPFAGVEQAEEAADSACDALVDYEEQEGQIEWPDTKQSASSDAGGSEHQVEDDGELEQEK